MQPVTQLDDQASMRREIGAPAFVHVAVLCRLPHQGPRWGSNEADTLAAALQDEGLTHFTYFPVDFAAAHGAEQIAAAFAQVQASLAAGVAQSPELSQSPQSLELPQPVDAVVVAGGHDIDSDIGVIHRVLAPCMRAAGVPVLSALGPDDAKTILGDAAWRVFPDPLRLLDSIAAAVRPAGLPASEICDQIRSLGDFLVTEHAIEARILRDAAIVPALQRHLDRHEQAFDQATRSVERTAEKLQVRLLREAGRLEQCRAKIGVELTRAQQRGKRRRSVGLGMLRAGVLAVFVCLTAALWMLTSPATTVFFSGCALVLLSAAYVGISNRIADHQSRFASGDPE